METKIETMQVDKQEFAGLCLFKSLIKDGAKWEGDVHSRKWSEYLLIDADDEFIAARVATSLSLYNEGTDYILEKGRDGKAYGVWIA